MEIIIALVSGLLLGSLVGFLYSKFQGQGNVTTIEQLKWQLEREQTNAKMQVENLQTQLEKTKTDFEERIAQVKADSKELLATQERNHEQALKAQQARFDETMAKVSAQVKIATDDMLKQRQKEFAESSNTNLGQIVTPLRETIEQMKRTMNDNTLKHTELSAAMRENIENMMKHSEAAKQSADELARVFKHKSKVQGNWGERVLEELLDSQGLQCGIHYERECVIRDAAGNVVKTDTGGNLRPDVILHLDTTREVIIDSKVSLTAFMDYVNAENDDARQEALKLHIDSIQKHVKELSKKDYSSYIQAPKQKMDYVIMFVPHTGALWTALNAQPDLWRKAMEQNVFIADEQTLFAALRMINLTWTQIKQAENHKEVYRLANEMVKRVGMFLKNYETVGKALKNARDAYEDGEKKLLDRGQSIVVTCNQLEALGAKQNASYPIPKVNEIEASNE
ncbi:MAG: DNA recombination protein RmuC [Bacteroidaceae bacterium]|nr:DNA recombination protein RmuC [Bacteroidaceae bacterium]